MGRGPRNIHAHLIEDVLLIRLTGVLTAAEQHLAAQSLHLENGRDLIKQVRTHLVEKARPLIETMIKAVTGIDMLSLHHDISTVTGEEILVFTLAGRPRCRETRKK